ncbi:MAG: hypothetical protein GY880_26950, partial [Planctomycetaceae bacterium]|nr:hypothetical protein [Planctomycetaceae bacterium]
MSVVAGRVLTVQNHQARGDSPFFSANDRSRWCTIRSLGDDGTYRIDEAIRRGQPIDWDSIDKVQHVGEDGRLHFYSSKPTLLPTLLAGVYRGVKIVTGRDLENDPIFVARLMLLLVNVGGWAVYLYFMALTINSIPVRDWSRYYVLACAGFGTYLSTYVNTLNNHLPAAISVMISLYCLSVIWRKENAGWRYFFAAGLFSAFAAANELPALSFFSLAALYCLVRSPRGTAFGFVPGFVLVAVGFFGTNFLAHGEYRPAYAHRGDGDVVKTLTGDFEVALAKGQLPPELNYDELGSPEVSVGTWPSSPSNETRWVVRDLLSAKQFSIVNVGDAGGAGFEYEIRQWDNWYDYPGSYWLDVNAESKSLVDRGQPSGILYAFHVLFGHHGVFSLTPMWVMSFAGMFSLLIGAKIAGQFQMRWLGLMTVVLSVVVIGFYLNRPEMDRNYGGVTSALRWLFWLAPLWLVCMLPVV